jgi:AraC-like DNA-binding protein
MQLKIDHAKKLLTTTNEKISSIAYSLGYEQQIIFPRNLPGHGAKKITVPMQPA